MGNEVISKEERNVVSMTAAGGMKLGLDAIAPEQLSGTGTLELRINHSKRHEEDGEPGTFRLGDANNLKTIGPVLFLKAHPFRSLNDGTPEKPHIICASQDGHTPLPVLAEPKHVSCGDCDYGQWGDKNPATGKSTPPACQQGFALFGILPEENNLPFVFVVRKTAVKPTVQFLRSIQQDPTLAGLPFARTRISLEAHRESFTWFTPLFTVLSKIEQTDPEFPAVYEMAVQAQDGLWYTPSIDAPIVSNGETVAAGTSWDVI